MFKTIFSIKIGVISGISISILLVCYHMCSLSTEDRRAMFLSFGGILMILGVILGGACSGYIIENYVISRFTRGGSIWGSVLGSIFISPLSLYYGIISGSLGGSFGERLTSKLGLAQVGIYLGIVFAIILVIIVIECIGAVIGAFLGSLIESLLRQTYSSKRGG